MEDSLILGYNIILFLYLFIVCILPRIVLPLHFPGGSAGKESTCNARDLGLIPGLGRSPEEGNGYPLQYSGLENSMDRIVHEISKNHLPWVRHLLRERVDRFSSMKESPWHQKIEVAGKRETILGNFFLHCCPWR